MSQQKTVAVITARGGSKRIPNKNIKHFHGKPIISYPINAALQSGLFDEVMVSTDCETIAELAIEFGAKVPFYRSSKNADDFSTTIDVVREVIGRYPGEFTQFCCLYPTAPFVTANELVLSCQQFRLHDSTDFCVPITAFSYPTQRCLLMTKGQLKFKHEKYHSTRSQDLEETYHDVGQYYWGKRNSLGLPSFFHGNSIGYKKTGMFCQDLDTLEDWEIAEYKYDYLKRKNLL